MLIVLSDYFGVGLRALLDGEEEGGEADRSARETAVRVAGYSSEERRRWTRRLHRLFLAGLLAALVYAALDLTGHADHFAGELCLGFMTGMLAVGAVMTSAYAARLREGKLRLLSHLRRLAGGHK